MNKSLAIFIQFLNRDFYIIRQRIDTFLFNYSVAYPAVYGICFGYIIPNVFFGPQSNNGTVILVGNILVPLILIIHRLATELLFDFDEDQYVAYQISVLNPRIVLIQYIVFSTLLGFALSLPFYPVAKLILTNNFDISNACWPQVLLMLFFSSLCISSYQFLVVCALKNASKLENFWIRFNQVLITLGGFWTPQATIAKFSPFLGKLALCNPYLYVTEGLRCAVIGSPIYTSVPVCVGALSLFTVLFTTIALYFFKRKIDHI